MQTGTFICKVGLCLVVFSARNSQFLKVQVLALQPLLQRFLPGLSLVEAALRHFEPQLPVICLALANK